MKNYDSLFNGQCNKPKPTCGCDSVKGNSIEVELHKDDCEVRADVIVARTSGVRIWGQVRDCDGFPVKYALIKLVKISTYCGKIDVQGVAHTISDCTGFYQFEVGACEVGAKYRVLVSKAAEGCERKVPESALLCDACAITPNPCPPNPCPPNPCKPCDSKPEPCCE